MENLEFQIPAFKGPMELLLHLLNRNKIDIYDIPIADITDQFLDYIDGMEEKNIDISSDFLVIATQLIEIKSKMLLPIHDEHLNFEFDENDPRYELVQRLLEYKKYKDVLSDLEIGYSEYGGIYLRENRINLEHYEDIKNRLEKNEKPLDPQVLLDSMMELISRIPEMDLVREKYFSEVQNIRKSYISVEEKVNILKDIIFESGSTTWNFDELAGGKDLPTVIVTFLAILELLKDEKVEVRQDEIFGSISIDRIKK